MKITRKVFTLPVILTTLLYLSLGNESAKAEQKILIQPIDKRAADHDDDPVHQIIKDHLAAIKARDADQAFSLTARSLHEKFNDAKNFLVSVRLEYRPIYNHISYSFLERWDSGDREQGNAIVQKVRIEDRYGANVTVIYRIKEDSSKIWRIDSFAVLDKNAQPI